MTIKVKFDYVKTGSPSVVTDPPYEGAGIFLTATFSNYSYWDVKKLLSLIDSVVQTSTTQDYDCKIYSLTITPTNTKVTNNYQPFLVYDVPTDDFRTVTEQFLRFLLSPLVSFLNLRYKGVNWEAVLLADYKSNKSIIPILIEAMRQIDPKVNAYASYLLTEFGIDVTPYILELLNDKDIKVKISAIRVLARVPITKEVLEAILNIATNRTENKDLRWTAINILGGVGNNEVIAELEQIQSKDKSRTSKGFLLSHAAKTAISQIRERESYNSVSL